MLMDVNILIVEFLTLITVHNHIIMLMQMQLLTCHTVFLPCAALVLTTEIN